MDSHILSERVVNGPMELFRARFPYRSCTCQDKPEIMKAWLIRKEGSEQLRPVRKNKLLDRVKNAEDAATAFLPFDELAKDVEEREYAYSSIEEAVIRFNQLVHEHRSPTDP